MDKSSIIGIFLAVAAIVTGLLIEGGSLRQVLQPTAAMIVFGGTLGAVMLQFPLNHRPARLQESCASLSP